MQNLEATPRSSRPPMAVVVMSMFWCVGACGEFLIWLTDRQTFYMIFAVFAAVFAALILKGFRWVFWVNLGILSVSLGITFLQLQSPSWAYDAPPVMLWSRAFIACCVIVLHQFGSLRRWFGISGLGKRWQTAFWLLVAGLTALGQYVLPTIKALRG
jgi:hypothetical protein